jgi:UDP-2,3-diacylglucosamine hydrolase
LRALFVSDLHLTQTRPQANETFFGFIEKEAREADELYILGDFFEYWIGDDDLADPFNSIIAGFLRRLAADGVKVSVMHGNRDFLLGQSFCDATGAQLLADPVEVMLDGDKTLLMHGDTLCTDDVDYQAWRKTARSQAWQEEFLAKSLDERRQTIVSLRDKSREVIQAKPAQIMDVNEESVRQALRRHGVRRLVHGHTHRPGRHTVEVDGRGCERWVLPDWYGPGGYLAIEDGDPTLVRFSK